MAAPACAFAPPVSRVQRQAFARRVFHAAITSRQHSLISALVVVEDLDLVSLVPIYQDNQGGPFRYRTKLQLQMTVALSLTEAKFMNYTDAGRISLYCRSIL